MNNTSQDTLKREEEQPDLQESDEYEKDYRGGGYPADTLWYWCKVGACYVFIIISSYLMYRVHGKHISPVFIGALYGVVLGLLIHYFVDRSDYSYRHPTTWFFILVMTILAFLMCLITEDLLLN